MARKRRNRFGRDDRRATPKGGPASQVTAVVLAALVVGLAVASGMMRSGSGSGGSGSLSVDFLITKLKSRGRNSHRWSPKALAAKGAAAVPALVTLVESGDDYERGRAFEVLEVMGPEAAQAEGALIHVALEDPDVQNRMGAECVLAKIGGPAVPTLIGLLEGEKREWRLARSVLPRSGKAALPALAATLNHREPRVRKLAIEILAEMVDQVRGAREAVEAACDHEDPEVRAIAERAVRD